MVGYIRYCLYNMVEVHAHFGKLCHVAQQHSSMESVYGCCGLHSELLAIYHISETIRILLDQIVGVNNYCTKHFPPG